MYLSGEIPGCHTQGVHGYNVIRIELTILEGQLPNFEKKLILFMPLNSIEMYALLTAPISNH